MLLLFQLFYITRTFADIIRKGGEFYAAFSVVKRGRLPDNILMYVEDIALNQCVHTCVQHQQCRSVNYNYHLRLCEIVDAHFDSTKINTDGEDWWNFGTAPIGW